MPREPVDEVQVVSPARERHVSPSAPGEPSSAWTSLAVESRVPEP